MLMSKADYRKSLSQAKTCENVENWSSQSSSDCHFTVASFGHGYVCSHVTETVTPGYDCEGQKRVWKTCDEAEGLEKSYNDVGCKLDPHDAHEEATEAGNGHEPKWRRVFLCFHGNECT